MACWANDVRPSLPKSPDHPCNHVDRKKIESWNKVKKDEETDPSENIKRCSKADDTEEISKQGC